MSHDPIILNLQEPPPRSTIAPPPRMTSARFWEDYHPAHLRAIRDKLGMVIDYKERQVDIFEPEAAVEVAPAPAPPTAQR